MTICNNEKCTGCGVCENICAHNAVKLMPNNRGFLYPVIETDKCVNCGLCKVKCTENNSLKHTSEQPRVYAAMSKQQKIRKESSSGGIFPLIAKQIIRDDGVVFGVRWSEKFETEFFCATTEEQLEFLYGSKYIQAKTNKIYIQVKKLLQTDVTVLFCGTPCQVAALYNFLGCHYENLYTIDLVCHGVPSYEIFEKHLNELSNNSISKIKNVNLRYKKPCWSYSSVKMDFSDGTYLKPTVEDAYYNLFNFNYTLRESCHKCRYTTVNRVSDITLSDFWGFVPKNFKMRNFDNGVSCILINNEKGAELFEKIKSNIFYEESSIKLAKQANSSLTKPFEKPSNNQEFWTDYDNGMSIKDLNEKYITKPYRVPNLLWLRRIKRKYKWIFGK